MKVKKLLKKLKLDEKAKNQIDESIKKVVVENGVTSIGAYSFCNIDNLKNIIPMMIINY